ncbi:hypothetical protein RB200_03310 [Streptomyces sp. PmtG]
MATSPLGHSRAWVHPHRQVDGLAVARVPHIGGDLHADDVPALPGRLGQREHPHQAGVPARELLQLVLVVVQMPVAGPARRQRRAGDARRVGPVGAGVAHGPRGQVALQHPPPEAVAGKGGPVAAVGEHDVEAVAVALAGDVEPEPDEPVAVGAGGGAHADELGRRRGGGRHAAGRIGPRAAGRGRWRRQEFEAEPDARGGPAVAAPLHHEPLPALDEPLGELPGPGARRGGDDVAGGAVEHGHVPVAPRAAGRRPGHRGEPRPHEAVGRGGHLAPVGARGPGGQRPGETGPRDGPFGPQHVRRGRAGGTFGVHGEQGRHDRARAHEYADPGGSAPALAHAAPPPPRVPPHALTSWPRRVSCV